MTNFIKYHLSISKHDFYQRKSCYSVASHGLIIKEIKPSFEIFSMLIDRVGSPWDWTRRPRYFDNEIEITARLNDPKSRIFVFFKKSIPVGYCLAVPFSSLTTNVQFSEDDDAIVEIENFGFFPEFTGLGYGQYILPQIFSRLFRSYELIYLSSRSTNHKKVIPFYKGLGMIVKLEEIKPNDLVPEDRILEEVMDKKTIHILK